jgi:glycerol-3-phosphate dehydrogenase
VSFSVHTRSDDLLDAADEVLDVLVVGMGATGAGVALDAASRGLRVAVVDKGDLASGTSSKSSKLVHGGLRYLENYEFSLVREGVTERQLLLRLAPHLVRPMDFLYPVWPDTAKRRLLGLGLTTYDAFAFALLSGGLGGGGVRRHQKLSAEEAVALAPALASSGLTHSYVYGDCATDDARLVLAVVQAARAFGALTVPYAEVTGLLHDGDGRVHGATVHDALSDRDVELRARHVVNATGVWVDRLQGLEEPVAPRSSSPARACTSSSPGSGCRSWTPRSCCRAGRVTAGRCSRSRGAARPSSARRTRPTTARSTTSRSRGATWSTSSPPATTSSGRA